jgi:hypothetical protein
LLVWCFEKLDIGNEYIEWFLPSVLIIAGAHDFPFSGDLVISVQQPLLLRRRFKPRWLIWLSRAQARSFRRRSKNSVTVSSSSISG